MAGTITIETVRHENAKLRQQNAVLRHENASFRADNDSLLHENQVLKAKIAKFESAGSNNIQATPKLFSQSSFGFPMDPNYLSHFTPIVIPSSPVLSNLPSSPTIAGAPAALSSPGPGLRPAGFPLPLSSNIVLPNQFSPHSPTLTMNQSAPFPNFLQATPNTVLRPPQTVNRSSTGSSPGSLAAPSLPMNPNAVPFTPIPPKGPQKPRSNSPSVGMVMPSRSKSSEDRSQGKNQPENSKRASATKKSNSKGSKKLTPPQKSKKSEKTSELQSPDPQRSVSRSPSKPRKKSRKSKKKGATPNKETKKNVKDVKKNKQTLDKNGSVANVGGTPPTSASSSVSPKPSVQNSKSPKSSNDSNSRGRGNASRGRSRGNRHRRRRR